MRGVDWVLVPSTWWEIFGLVVSEAWMFGRPVIASAIAGLKERVMPNVNGFTFPARDSRALADLIASLAGDEQQWLKVNRTIEQPWTEIEMLEAYESAWQEVQTKQYRLISEAVRSIAAIVAKVPEQAVEIDEKSRPKRPKLKRSHAAM